MKYINIELDGIDTNDYPDFCDAYIIYAEHSNGIPLSDKELDDINQNSDLVYSEVCKKLF